MAPPIASCFPVLPCLSHIQLRAVRGLWKDCMLAIWVVFAVLAAGGAMLIVRPLLVRPKDIAGTAAVETEATLNIYRDQFAEIERELERGLRMRSAECN